MDRFVLLNLRVEVGGLHLRHYWKKSLVEYFVTNLDPCPQFVINVGAVVVVVAAVVDK